MGTLMNVSIMVAEVTILLGFAVVQMQNEKRTYPTLLGRPWLLATKAIQD